MSNHFHLLLEVPPMLDSGITDEELLKRLGAIYTEAFVATVAKELKEARKTENQRLVDEIHARFTYRMHDLSEFMKTLLQRFCPRSTRAMRSGRASSGAPPMRLAATAA
jgi:putative transposase